MPLEDTRDLGQRQGNLLVLVQTAARALACVSSFLVPESLGWEGGVLLRAQVIPE
jgi:hypothetical protein